MDLRLTSRVAIVAAANNGLGRTVAEELAREGAHLTICALTASTIAETAAPIQKTTCREVLRQALDVTDLAAFADLVAAVETRRGRIDICVTNSGDSPSNFFDSTQPENMRSTVDGSVVRSLT